MNAGLGLVKNYSPCGCLNFSCISSFNSLPPWRAPYLVKTLFIGGVATWNISFAICIVLKYMINFTSFIFSILVNYSVLRILITGKCNLYRQCFLDKYHSNVKLNCLFCSHEKLCKFVDLQLLISRRLTFSRETVNQLPSIWSSLNRKWKLFYVFEPLFPFKQAKCLLFLSFLQGR